MFEKSLLFLGSRGSPCSVVTLAIEACGKMRSQNSVSDCDEGVSVPHKLPLEPECSLRWLWHGDGGRGKRGGGSFNSAGFIFCRNPLRKFLRESVCRQFHVHLWQNCAARLKAKSSSLLCA